MNEERRSISEPTENEIEEAKKWWESEIARRKREGKLRDISPSDLDCILTQSKNWYETDGNEKREGKPAKLAGTKLDTEDLRKPLPGAILVGADLRWANLYETDLAGANLWRARLRGAMLIRASFDPDETKKSGQGESMSPHAVIYSLKGEVDGTRLTGTLVGPQIADEERSSEPKVRAADLTDADLQEAHLRDARLATVTGLRADRLRGADLTNAKLPPDIARFDTLTQVEKISQNASTTFFALLAASLYSWLTIATTTDVALLTDRTSTPLPIINTNISLPAFYLTAPLILLATYLYLHFYLQRLWQGLSTLPAFFPDGKALDEKVYPWLLNGLVRAHFLRLKFDRPALSRLENYLSIVLAWCVVPLTLLAFWLRYLPRHDWSGALLLLCFFVVATGFGRYSYLLAVDTLSGEKQELETAKAKQAKRGYRPDRWTIVFSALALIFTLRAAINPIGPDDWRPRPRQQDWWPHQHGVMAGLTGYLSFLPKYGTYADLRDAEVSVKPANWTGQDKLAPTEMAQVKGADLRERDLRAAVANNAFLVKARLDKADLQGANFQGADLREVDFAGADLRRTELGGANLEDAKNLSQEQLDVACGDKATKLPKGLTINLCGSKQRTPAVKNSIPNPIATEKKH
jgi:uncharacterized protein YjbI with pentapeptide repeats